MPRKCVIVWFPHEFDRYVIAGLTAVLRKKSAPGINIISSVFGLTDRALEKQLSTQENGI